MTQTEITRFLSKVSPEPNTGCWLWVGGYGGPEQRGYFRTTQPRRWAQASRLAWAIWRGDIPEGLCVLHRCDMNICVNPSHLFLGTVKDNVADKMAKGRQACGAAHGSAKLSAADVVAIRDEYARGGVSMAALAVRYGVSVEPIHGIVRHRYWRHLDDHA